MKAIAVKSQSRGYGYSVKIVEGKIPSYIKRNPFYWYKYKRDAIETADRITKTGKV